MSAFLPSGEEEVRKHDHALRRLARSVVHSQADADDVAQEAWLRSLERPPRHRQNLSGWWITITRRAAMRLVGRENSRRSRLREVARPVEAAPEDEEVARASAEHLIARLEDPYREVLRLRFLDDLTPAEIAELLGRPEVTVRSQISRGLSRLRERTPERERPVFAWWFGRRLARLSVPVRRLGAAALVAGALVAGALFVLVRVWLTDDARASGPVLATVPATDAAPAAPLLSPAIVRVPAPELPAPPRPAIEPVPARARVAGLVTWQAKPVGAAEIFAAAREDEAGERVGFADDEGRFAIELSGSALVWAEGTRRDDAGFERERTRSKRYLVQAKPGDDVAGLALEFVHGRPFEGVLLDAAGAPVADTLVQARADRRPYTLGTQGWLELAALGCEARTDGEGRFRLPTLNDGTQALVVVRDGLPAVPLESGASKLGERLQLPAGGTLRGRLLSSAGTALAGAELWLRNSFGPSVPVGRTDAEGRWSVADVPPGPFEIVALPEQRELSLVRNSRLAAGQVLDLGDLVARPDASIRGRVLERGQPCAGWIVGLSQEDAPARPARVERTGADGTFVFRACPDVAYTLRLTEPGGETCRVLRKDVRTSAVPLELAVEPAPSLLVALYPERAPGARLTLRGDGLVRPIGLEEGSMPALALVPGHYELSEFVPGLGEWRHGDVELAPGERRVLDLAPPPTGSLRVSLTFPAGLEQERHIYTLHGAGRTWQATTKQPPPAGVALDPVTGELSYPALLPGEYMLDARSGGVGLVERWVQVRAGEETALAIAFQPGHAVVVRCRGERKLDRGEAVAFRLTSGEEKVLGPLWPERLDLTDEVTQVFRGELAPGAYEFTATSSLGLTGTLRFTVPGPGRYELWLRPPDAPAAAATR